MLFLSSNRFPRGLFYSWSLIWRRNSVFVIGTTCLNNLFSCFYSNIVYASCFCFWVILTDLIFDQFNYVRVGKSQKLSYLFRFARKMENTTSSFRLSSQTQWSLYWFQLVYAPICLLTLLPTYLPHMTEFREEKSLLIPRAVSSKSE